MQPCDTITLLALVNELSRQLLNARFERVQYVSKDEVALLLRLRSGKTMSRSLFVSSHPYLGRLCLEDIETKGLKASNNSMALALKKHLSGGRIVALRQPKGERVVDIVFACPDELGASQLKILTLELMGKHSNIIFWDNATKQILAVAKTVTADMSRQRELASGLPYVRPPKQVKPNLWQQTKSEFLNYCAAKLYGAGYGESALWAGAQLSESLSALFNTGFSGLGKDFSIELSEKLSRTIKVGTSVQDIAEQIWLLLEPFCNLPEVYKADVESSRLNEQLFKPGLAQDYTSYSVLSWSLKEPWQYFDSVNDLICSYYNHHQNKSKIIELRARLAAKLDLEELRYKQKLSLYQEQITSASEADLFGLYADMILAHINDIARGAQQFVCDNLYLDKNQEAVHENRHSGTVQSRAGQSQIGQSQIIVPLDPVLSASQNAQRYYKLANKIRTRVKLANAAMQESQDHIDVVEALKLSVEAAKNLDELSELKTLILGSTDQLRDLRQSHNSNRLPLKVVSSDGLVIYAGRNRFQNDVLLQKLAQSKDIWLHLSGQSSAHVLIKMALEGDSPPARTLEEAGLLAARLSKKAMLGKVRVLYTQYRYVRKLPGGPGLVRYENEKTFEVDLQTTFSKALEEQLAKAVGKA